MAEMGEELGPVLNATGQAPEAQKALGSRGEEQWSSTGKEGHPPIAQTWGEAGDPEISPSSHLPAESSTLTALGKT